MKPLQVFWQFFLLGWISFGGPMAHLGYFRHHFVEKLKWINATDYAQLIALSQFLPGPGSSQVGFAIGLKHAGILGGWAAFIGFTLPSFMILLWVALYQPTEASALYQQVISGLKLLAIVVVADATLSMFNNFCRNRTTQLTAALTASVLLLFPSAWVQLLLLMTAFLIGRKILTSSPQKNSSRKQTFTSNSVFLWILLSTGLLLIVLNLVSGEFLPVWLQLFADFLQAGALVFGGGHAVLPLLQTSVGAQIPSDQFLSGYAMAQAIPGPMFTFATYLGALLLPQSPILGAIIATLGIFLPGLLLVMVMLNNWHKFADNPKTQGGVAMLNAAVVGLLIATLFSPSFTATLFDSAHFAWILIGFSLLKLFKVHILWFLLGFGLLFPVVSHLLQ